MFSKARRRAAYIGARIGGCRQATPTAARTFSLHAESAGGGQDGPSCIGGKNKELGRFGGATNPCSGVPTNNRQLPTTIGQAAVIRLQPDAIARAKILRHSLEQS